MSPPATTNSRNVYMVGIAWRAASTTSCSIRLLKKASLPTSNASVRAWTKLTKAASISRSVPAFNIWTFTPMARAAASTSLVLSSDTRIVRILKKADRRNTGHQLVQKRERLGPEFARERVEAGQVASRPIEARHKPELQGVI